MISCETIEFIVDHKQIAYFEISSLKIQKLRKKFGGKLCKLADELWVADV